MPRTRSSKPPTKENDQNVDADTQTRTLPAEDSNPPKLLVLPKNISSRDSRIITLKCPATGRSNRYFYCPQRGFHEFTRIAAPRSLPKSWLVVREQPAEEKTVELLNGLDSSSDLNASSSGHILKNADLFLATPLDPIFLVLPIISPPSTEVKGSKKSMFLTFDDHLDMGSEVSPHLQSLLRLPQCRSLFETRLRAICDMVEAGDEAMFRLSFKKTAKELFEKAERLVQKGLPASMEERFIRRALQSPVMTVGQEDSTQIEPDTQASATSSAEATTASDSQQTASTSITSISSTTTVAIDSTATASSSSSSSFSSSSDDIIRLLRIRTCLDFMIKSYINPTLHPQILDAITTSGLVNFSALNAHLKHLESLRSEAQALRTLSDNVSRKRDVPDDDEAVEARAEKKRRKEEEDKKKKTESRAIKDLKKADTTGMKKLSSFFTKVPKKDVKT